MGKAEYGTEGAPVKPAPSWHGSLSMGIPAFLELQNATLDRVGQGSHFVLRKILGLEVCH